MGGLHDGSAWACHEYYGEFSRGLKQQKSFRLLVGYCVLCHIERQDLQDNLFSLAHEPLIIDSLTSKQEEEGRTGTNKPSNPYRLTKLIFGLTLSYVIWIAGCMCICVYVYRCV